MSENTTSTFIVDGKEINVSHGIDWSVNETGVYKGESLVSSSVWIKQAIVSMESTQVKVVINGVNTINNVLFEHITDYASLQDGFNNPLMKELGNYGMKPQRGEIKNLFEFLSQQQDLPMVYSFDKLGWHTTDDELLFVLPSHVLGIHANKNYLYMPNSIAPSQRALVTSGTLESWQQNVVSACTDNPIPLFALGIAFAAPLMHLFNVDGGGFHFWGASSRGKTLLLQVAATVFGNGADPAQLPDGSLIQRWNTTANALEGTALAFNDLLLPMDELGTSNIKNFGQAIYQLSGGVGKQAMNANRDIRPIRTWRTLIISSGEYAITHEIEATSGSQARTGQMIRFIDVSVDNVFPAWGDVSASKKKADDLKVACSQYFGMAAIPFLEYVLKIANHETTLLLWKNKFELIEDALANEYESLQAEQRRAIKRFALVACGLLMAVEAKCIVMSDTIIMDSVAHVLSLWLAEFPTVSEAERGVEHLKQFILRNLGRFGDANVNTIDGCGNNLVGYIDNSKNKQRYIIFKEKMAEACGRPNVKPVLKELKRQGYLSHNADRMDLKWRNTTVFGVHFALIAETAEQGNRAMF